MNESLKVILLDIEGTTTPIDFVHKILFPYSRERMDDFVRANFDLLNDEICQLKQEHRSDSTYGRPFDENSAESVSEYLACLIDNDRKSTPLKSIQGKIWEMGYRDGTLTSIVFDDVPSAFERWTADGKQIAIYSSGSVFAQRLLFGHTNHGDLTRFISKYFDTTSGGKREETSYSSIARKLGIESNGILFVSDIIAELEAARSAGMRTALSVRGTVQTRSETNDHPVINNFDELE